MKTYASNNRFYDTCLLAGKALGNDCSRDIVVANRKGIKNVLEENKKTFTETNFTGVAFKFHLNNDSSSYLSNIAIDIDNLNNDESFECGLFIKPENVNIIGDNKGGSCGLDTCKIHLDYLHYQVDGIHDMQSWQMKIEHFFASGARVGGRNCHLYWVYAWTMVIPILLNLLFSGMIFYNDWRSGISSKYETPFLLLLLYPQWRTLKILLQYLKHKEEGKLANQLVENDKEVSFIEPFCESGMQVRLLSSFRIFTNLTCCNIPIESFVDLKLKFFFHFRF